MPPLHTHPKCQNVSTVQDAIKDCSTPHSNNLSARKEQTNVTLGSNLQDDETSFPNQRLRSCRKVVRMDGTVT